MTQLKPLPDPRIQGIHEHFKRVDFFTNLAKSKNDLNASYRFALAAIYSCRAITELMLEAADKQVVKMDRVALENLISPKIPFYFLIERIRIHDFHRYGLPPPDPNVFQMSFGGPIKLTAQNGLASISPGHQGIQQTTTGNSSIKLQRPLLVRNGEFFDDDSNRFVSLHQILETFLVKCPKIIKEFDGLVA